MRKSIRVTRRQFLKRGGLSLAGIVATGSLFGKDTIYGKTGTGIREPQQDELPPHIKKNNLSGDPLLKLGYLNAHHYAKGDGVTDDTENLRKAISDAQLYQYVLYLPAGTYLISDTLDMEHVRPAEGFFIHGIVKDDFLPQEYKLNKYYVKGFFIQGDPDNRPVIKLKDNAIGFDKESSPRYILRIWENGDSWKSVMSFVPQIVEGIREFGPGLMNHAGVSSIIIDCGSGNPGAIGFKCWGAQGIYAENITIRAYGALAGVRDLIGNGGYMANFEVFGGKYGVWAKNGQPGCIAGLTLIDQEEAAIRQEMPGWPYSIVGFNIIKERGPIVTINKTTKFNSGFHLSLVDGTVELKTKGIPFVIKKDEEGRSGSLYLRNVYVKNANILISSSGDEPVSALDNQWSHIHEYCGMSSDSENIVDGKKIGKSVIVDKKMPSASLMTMHMLSRDDLPFGLDRNSVSVYDPVRLGDHTAKGDGITDDTENIQYAIDHFEKVFLPKGKYSITSPLILRKKTRLFGITSALSILKTDSKNWNSNSEKVVLTTVDDPDASCMASQISIFTSCRESGSIFKIMVWSAGRNSVVKNVVAAPFRDDVESGTVPPADHLILITDHGGGRRYGDSTGAFYYIVPDIAQSYRHFMCLDTREPLRFYSFNPEHACSDAEIVIQNCRNIEIYGIKTEGGFSCTTSGNLFKISGSENIFITVSGNNGKKTIPGNSLFNIIKSENVALTTLSQTRRPKPIF